MRDFVQVASRDDKSASSRVRHETVPQGQKGGNKRCRIVWVL